MAYKLLLADDSVTIQRVIELTFADEDIHVIAVGDGQQAIDKIRAERPDIVLADVGMPERDGFEVCSFVKQAPELSHIPVLLLTGAFEPVDQDRLRAVGCDGVLAKPFEPQLLIQRVKELLTTPPEQRLAQGAELTLAEQPLQAPPATEGFDHLRLPVAEPADSRAAADEYFDRLDAAFAAVAGPADVQPARPAVAPKPAPVPPPRAVTGVSPELAAAFDWLLAAEQGKALPAGALPLQPQSPSAALDTVIDEVTRRVIERLADRSVRDQVADLVSKVAERVVRDEIERLKAGLK